MEGLEIYTVELYRKVRLACADGMSKRAAARHFNISRDSVDKILAFSTPPIAWQGMFTCPRRGLPAAEAGWLHRDY
jgi:hypothetical protein